MNLNAKYQNPEQSSFLTGTDSLGVSANRRCFRAHLYRQVKKPNKISIIEKSNAFNLQGFFRLGGKGVTSEIFWV